MSYNCPVGSFSERSVAKLSYLKTRQARNSWFFRLADVHLYSTTNSAAICMAVRPCWTRPKLLDDRNCSTSDERLLHAFRNKKNGFSRSHSRNATKIAAPSMWAIMWKDAFQLVGRGERKDSVMEIPERFYDRNSESDEDEKWRYAIHLARQVETDQSLCVLFIAHFRRVRACACVVDSSITSYASSIHFVDTLVQSYNRALGDGKSGSGKLCEYHPTSISIKLTFNWTRVT